MLTNERPGLGSLIIRETESGCHRRVITDNDLIPGHILSSADKKFLIPTKCHETLDLCNVVLMLQ